MTPWCFVTHIDTHQQTPLNHHDDVMVGSRFVLRHHYATKTVFLALLH